ncbi:acireductone synthase [Leucobacter iarius]|uniref:Methylthioribulose-1-phosphate dehydratase n=1 Tax=Leucobacter iarius TaxID=333963 RepID=A0ABN2L7Y9_9MICO
MTAPTPVTADAVVVDLEGTTSAAGFILGDLYDYARPRLDAVLGRADDVVQQARAQVIVEAGLHADASDAEVADALRRLMDSDIKSTPLKTIQGVIWAEGFAAGEITSHFFDDVPPRLRDWHERGIRIAVYSSGSVASQQPWFRNAPQGDLSGLVEAWFDTVNAGPKKDPASYARIADALGTDPGRTLFLTDHPEEVDAALDAGWRVVALDRAGEPWAGADFSAPAVPHFDRIEVVLADAPADADAAPTAGAGAPLVPAERLREAGRVLAAEASRFADFGWMRGTAGNLSAVVHRDPLLLAVTASGLDKSELTERDVVLVDAAGRSADPADARKPSAESGLHAHIAARTGAEAVFHVHALDAVLAGQLWPQGVEIRDLEMLKGIGHPAHDATVRIPVIANHQDMAVEAARFDEVYAPATDGTPEVPALIVAGHGMYAWGRTATAARHHLEIVEWLLRHAVAARGL